jgi:Ca-activated chloride channel homolog
MRLIAATAYVALDPHTTAHEAGRAVLSTPAPDEVSSSLGGTPVPLRTSALPADHLPASAGAAPCTDVRVLASLENADVLRALARGYAGAKRNVAGRCVTVSVSADKSGLAEAGAAKGFATLPAAQRPTVWAPDSTAWLDLAARDGATARSGLSAGRSLAESAIVLAMPAELAEAIGWASKAPSWAEIFATAGDAGVWANRGHPEWGGFKLGKTSPQVATSGLLGMAASYGVAAGGLESLTTADLGRADIVAKVHAAELSVTHYMATPEHFLWHVRQAEDSGSAAEFLSAVIVDEKSVWDYNRGLSSRDGITEEILEPPAEPLVPIYPRDGTFTADSPAAVLNASWTSPAQRAASKDFIDYATTAQGQAVVRANGCRDVRGQADTEVSLTGRYTSPVTSLRIPSVTVLARIVHDFPEVRKRARVLFLLDVSRSMAADVAPGLTRLAAAKQAIVAALAHFTPDDQVGLAAFSNQTGGPIVPGVVAPVAPLKTARAGLLKAVAGLQPVAQTPLFAAVATNAIAMAKNWRPDVINAIVLLSDGHNDTDIAGTLQTLTDNIGHLHHVTPVLVFTLAYGKDADVPTLQAIAKMTGAHYYDATDPATIQPVLGDLVTSF